MTKATRWTMGACLALSLGGCQAFAPIQSAPSINAPSTSNAVPVENETTRPLDINLGNVSLQVNLPIPEHAVRMPYSAQAVDSYTYANVTDIRITVIGADIPTPVVASFEIGNGATSVSHNVSIPVGKNRVFLIEAVDHNAPNRTFGTIAKIRAVADVTAGESNVITVNSDTTATAATFAKLITDGRNGNATALNLAKTMAPAAVQAWVGTNLTRYGQQVAGQFVKHPTLVDTDKLAIYLRDNAGALPAAGTAAEYLLGGTLTVNLRDRSTEAPLTDATLTLSDFASPKAGTSANTNGVYTLTDLTPGTWSLTVTSPTRVSTSVKVTVEARENIGVTVDVDGDAALTNFAGGGTDAYTDLVSAQTMQLTNPTGVAVFTNPKNNISTSYKDLTFFCENTADGNIYRVNADRTITRTSTGVVPYPYKMKFDHLGNLWVSSGVTLPTKDATTGGLFRFDRLASGELSTTPTRVVANHTAAIGHNATQFYGGPYYFHAVGGFDVRPDGEVYFQSRSDSQQYYGPNHRTYFYKIGLDGILKTSGYPEFATTGVYADLALDASGQLFKSSTNGIQLFVKNAWVNFVGGTAVGSTGHGLDRTHVDAKVNAPNFLQATADGNLYFADTANRALRMVAGNGKLFNVVGTPGVQAGYTVGLAPLDPNIRLNTLAQSAFDSMGNLYLVDNGNKRLLTIRKGDSNAAIAASF